MDIQSTFKGLCKWLAIKTLHQLARGRFSADSLNWRKHIKLWNQSLSWVVDRLPSVVIIVDTWQS